MASNETQDIITLRKPVRADAQAILECHQQAIQLKALRYYGKKIVEGWSPRITPESIQKVELEIVQPDWIYVVAENFGGIVGFGIVVPEVRELRAVYVKPNRSGAVGTLILQELLRQARMRVLEFLEMDASSNAAPFYERNGFKILSRSMHVLNTGDEMDCVRMRIDL